ncbi:MAG TPA: hypothetical protein VD948_07990 [Rhodothermales bacterium]|nr:hypothetical protein [Rhodothermales bacterium]
MSSPLLRYAPAWLIGLGILLTWGAALLVTPSGANVWQVGLVAAVGVGVPSSCLAWIFRGQQRLAREAAIDEVREMMADGIKNQLAVIGMCAPLAGDHEASQMALDGINTSIGQINTMVDSLSNESLVVWKTRYRHALQNGRLAPA